MSLTILAIVAHLSNPARTIYSVAPNLTELEVASLPVHWVIGQGKSKIKNNHASEYQVLLLLLSNPVNSVLLNVAKNVSCSNFGEYFTRILLHRIEILFGEGKAILPEKDPI